MIADPADLNPDPEALVFSIFLYFYKYNVFTLALTGDFFPYMSVFLQKTQLYILKYI